MLFLDVISMYAGLTTSSKVAIGFIVLLCKLGIPNVLMLISLVVLISTEVRTGLRIIIHIFKHSTTLP